MSTYVPMEEIVSRLKELGIDSSWINFFVEYASMNGFKVSLPEPRLTAAKDKVYITFGDPDSAASAGFSKLKLDAWKSAIEWAIDERGGVFHIPRTKANETENDTSGVQDRQCDLSSPQSTQPKKETSATEENKDQGEATKHGPALTVEEITGILIDLGVSENDVKESFVHLPTKLAIGKLPNVTIHRVDDKITLTYGNTEKATLLDKAAAQDARLPDSMRLSPEEIRYEAFHDVVNQSGLYIYTVSPKEEAKMSNEQNPTDADLVWKKLRQQLEAAKLSQQSIDGIMHTLRHDAGLKKPTEESVLLCTKGRNVTNVYYSHAGKPVTLTDVEQTHTFDDGETLSYSAGHRDAFFVVDTTNVKTFEEKMIHWHLGVPKVKLELSSGYSVDLPFKKTYEAVTRDQVLVRITCDALVSVSAKVLESLTGPALTDLQGTQADRYFIRGNELTEKVFHKRAALGAGSWADIEKA